MMTAAEIGGVDKPRTGGIQFRHKGVIKTAIAGKSVVPLESAKRCRKVWRVSSARDVGVAGCVYGDSGAVFIANATQVGGIDEDRAGGIELRHEDIPGERSVACEDR